MLIFDESTKKIQHTRILLKSFQFSKCLYLIKKSLLFNLLFGVESRCNIDLELKRLVLIFQNQQEMQSIS